MTTKRLYQTTLLGFSIWLAWALLAAPTWTQILLVFSPFVLFPLGLRVDRQRVSSPTAGIDTGSNIFEWFRTAAATLAAVSFTFEPGILAAGFTLPWLLLTGMLCVKGLLRFLSRRTALDASVGADAGLIFVLVGGLWLTISRLGVRPLEFSDSIVELTAVHFHYAGFALPIVAAAVSSELATNRRWLLSWGVIVGVPVTAVGITVGGTTEFIAAYFMASVGLVVAFVMGLNARTSRSAIIALASISLVGGMVMAFVWATFQQFDLSGVDLKLMARTHGTLNALGFGFLGLLGLNQPFPPLVQEQRPADQVEDTPIVVDEVRSVLFGLGHPSLAQLRRLYDLDPNPLSYDRKQLASTPKVRSATWHRTLGEGRSTFDAAAEAMKNWKGHQGAGIVRYPEKPSLAVGSCLSLAVPVGPIYATATCEVVDVIDESNRFGFSYGTKMHHFQVGEEQFLLEYKTSDNSVTLTLSAVFVSGSVMTTLARPVANAVQKRLLNKYLDSMVLAAN